MGVNTLPAFFRKGGEQALANFDFTDFAARTGYIRLYGGASRSGAATTYFLSPNVTQADTDKTIFTTTETAYTNALDMDFDITFNSPQTIRGDFLINASTELLYSGGGSPRQWGYILFTIYHVTSGGTETSLGTFTTLAYESAAGRSKRDLAKINVSSKVFGIGEKLRVNVIIYTKHFEAAADNSQGYFYHDPANRKDTTYVDEFLGITSDSTFIVDVPFRIDL